MTGGTAPVSRRQARRQALFLLYQWDLTGLPLESLFEGSPDEPSKRLSSGSPVRSHW